MWLLILGKLCSTVGQMDAFVREEWLHVTQPSDRLAGLFCDHVVIVSHKYEFIFLSGMSFCLKWSTSILIQQLSDIIYIMQRKRSYSYKNTCFKWDRGKW